MDVYKIADAVTSEFPKATREQLVQIVSEEVVRARGNAYWGKQDASDSPLSSVSGTTRKQSPIVQEP